MSNSSGVNTKQVTGRRTVSYATYDDLLADAERLAGGEVRTLGNWSYGQILKHLAVAINWTIDGAQFTAPWPMRFVAQHFLKGTFLNKTLKPGFKFPDRLRPQLEAPADVDVGESLSDLRAAVERAKTETTRAPNPLLGELTPAEHEKFQLRHAEMHMSFVLFAE